MKKKRVLSFILVVLLLAGVSSAYAATAGSAQDPLISLSYTTGTYISSVISQARTIIDKALNPIYEQLSDSADAVSSAAGTGSFTVKSVASGGSVTMKTGGSLILLSGAARMSISGTVVDVSEGAVASDGDLAQYARYLACEDTTATISVTGPSLLAIDGNVIVSGTSSQFSDVLATDWFFTDVVTATEKGLINGKTTTTYEPNSNLTTAEAIKLAACLHQMHSKGSITLENSTSGAWYTSYVNYALSNSIITSGYSNYSTAISRAEFVHIFYSAMPSNTYTQINSVVDGAIPDVGTNSTYSSEIYTFYRAGILTGSDSAGTFNPSTNIRRSEVAAILTRMYDSTARKSVTLS